jgi:hypothetical protein
VTEFFCIGIGNGTLPKENAGQDKHKGNTPFRDPVQSALLIQMPCVWSKSGCCFVLLRAGLKKFQAVHVSPGISITCLGRSFVQHGLTSPACTSWTVKSAKHLKAELAGKNHEGKTSG